MFKNVPENGSVNTALYGFLRNARAKVEVGPMGGVTTPGIRMQPLACLK